MAKKLAAPVERLAYTPAQAAASIGVGLDFFNEHVRPQLAVILVGRKVLIQTSEWNAGLPSVPNRH